MTIERSPGCDLNDLHDMAIIFKNPQELFMKRIQQTILAFSALLLAGVAAPVYADDQASNNGSDCRARLHGDPVANSEKHLSVLKKELKITGDQEQAWSTYAEATQRNVKDIRDRTNAAMHEQPQTAPERFDRHIALMRERLASFEKMDDALKQLYLALTPEQKSTMDRHFAKMRH